MCRYSGMDMDLEPFCAHPAVCAELGYPYGINFSTGRDKINTVCPSSQGLPLYEKHPLR